MLGRKYAQGSVYHLEMFGGAIKSRDEVQMWKRKALSIRTMFFTSLKTQTRSKYLPAPGFVDLCTKTNNYFSCSSSSSSSHPFVLAGMSTAMSRRRVSCRELGRPDCDGWLWKKRKESNVFLTQKWQRFWFVLKGPSLYWYTSQQVGIKLGMYCVHSVWVGINSF